LSVIGKKHGIGEVMFLLNLSQWPLC